MLEKETDAKGRKFVVHKLPAPPPMFYSEEDIKGLEKENGDYVRSVGTLPKQGQLFFFFFFFFSKVA